MQVFLWSHQAGSIYLDILVLQVLCSGVCVGVGRSPPSIMPTITTAGFMSISDDHVIHWNVTATVEVEIAIASTTSTTQRSRRGNRPDYGSFAERAPALQTNKDVTSSQVNQELTDALEVEQENEENTGLSMSSKWTSSLHTRT